MNKNSPLEKMGVFVVADLYSSDTFECHAKLLSRDENVVSSSHPIFLLIFLLIDVV
jgi:hypothetical protein